MKTCVLICNLESGKGIKRKQLDNIICTLENRGYSTKLYITQKQFDAKNIVKSIDYVDLVLGIGGDGTFNEIVYGNYLRKDKLLISHIPIGTANDIGNMFGLGKNIYRNLISILDGEVKQIDIGIINNRPFIYVAGFGKFINVPNETSRKLKKKFGYFAYFINGIKEFFNKTKLYELDYTIDGVNYKGLFSLILISNANRIAGFNNVYKDVKLDDNKFEIVFCNITKRNDLIKTLLIMIKSGITSLPGIYCYTGSNIKIKFKDEPISNFTIDGDKYKQNTNTYEISIDKSFKMLIPKKNIDKLFL